jgi:glycosyltransferase involved in cell wall biosynthesis
MANWGGSEELWSKTALLALEKGYEVESLTYGWDPVSPRITKLREAGVNTKFYYNDSRRLTDRVAVRLGIKKVRSEELPALEADIYVISNGSTWDFAHNTVITNRIIALGKPFILLNHNSLDSGSILDEVHREYAINVFKKASKTLFVSERNLLGAERQIAYIIPRTQVVGNPISIREAIIRPFPISDKLLLAFVGSIECTFKGIDLLLEALSGEVWQKRDFHLKLYGKGPHEQHIRRLIELYNLQRKVTLEGHVSNVDQIWETNQALVVSSTSEGVPMVVVEAMLSGRTVLGTDVGAVDRYVKEDETGFLVAVAKARYLNEGLEKLWQNRDKLQKMGEKAFARACAITDMNPEESFLNIIEAVGKADAVPIKKFD